MGTVCSWPSIYSLKIVATTPQAAGLIADAMREVASLKKPWYGFQLLSAETPTVTDCTVQARVRNADGDMTGLIYNRNNIQALRALLAQEYSDRGDLENARVLFG